MVHDIENLMNTERLFIKNPNRFNDETQIDFVKELALSNPKSKKEYEAIKSKLLKKYQLNKTPRGSDINYIYRTLFVNGLIQESSIQKYIKLKPIRSQSGIMEVAFLTSPWDMTGKNNGCDYDCYFCPNQKGMPRSYIKEEPAVKRAASNKFDIVQQIYDRLTTYDLNGTYPDKIEIIILGGTWSSYSPIYQTSVMRDMYYAANTYYSIEKRERLSMIQEKIINENALCKIVGVTIETRPDCITAQEVQRLLEFGVTRVQLGIQSTNNTILKKINRQCYNKDTITALRIIKNAGLKTLIHIMPNLPFSNPEIDKETFHTILYNEKYLADEWKIYPTSVTTTSERDNEEVLTVIEKWYNSGKYIPYSNEELFELLVYVKERVHPYIRISRIFRDIPLFNITGGADIPNMRQVLKTRMHPERPCKCIRCREIRNIQRDSSDIKLCIRRFTSSGATEYFISYETRDNSYIYGFLRLRMIKETSIKELNNVAVVRELHVYGNMTSTFETKKDIKEINTQHKGLGTQLLYYAEWLAYMYNYNGIAINAGAGVRGYYKDKKRGYKTRGEYVVKMFSKKLENAIVDYIYYLIMVYIVYKINILGYFYEMFQ